MPQLPLEEENEGYFLLRIVPACWYGPWAPGGNGDRLRRYPDMDMGLPSQYL